MTTNQEHAALVIRQKLTELWGRGAIFDTRAFPQMAVDALADAGLLMPDLPEPSTTPDTDPEYANQYREEWDSEPPIAVWNHKDTDWWLSVYASGQTAGGWSEYAEEEFDHLNAKKLRAIAPMMIAAADKIDQIKKATPAL